MLSRHNVIQHIINCCIGMMIVSPSCAFAVGGMQWETLLRARYFDGREINTSDPVIRIQAPQRAEDPAMVPVRIESRINQTETRFIKTITVIVDENPAPLAGQFHFTPSSGRADLVLRMRINSYSSVRAIAELNDGSLSMDEVFVKASGGCSAPVGADMEEAMSRLGKIRFRVFPNEGGQDSEPTLAQVMVSHPNLSGMQMNQVTRLYQPAHYVNKVKITFNNREVLSAETGIAISADPNFRFYFVPTEDGVLEAEIEDSKGNVFSKKQQITHQ